VIYTFSWLRNYVVCLFSSRRTLLDVVFDHIFRSGTALSGGCFPFQGMAVPVLSARNRANCQIIVGSKASELAEPPHTTATPDRRTPSPTPPQLMNRFSSDVTGDGRGSREGAHSPRGGGRGRGSGEIGSNSCNHIPRPRPHNNSDPNRYPSSRAGGRRWQKSKSTRPWWPASVLAEASVFR